MAFRKCRQAKKSQFSMLGRDPLETANKSVAGRRAPFWPGIHVKRSLSLFYLVLWLSVRRSPRRRRRGEASVIQALHLILEKSRRAPPVAGTGVRTPARTRVWGISRWISEGHRQEDSAPSNRAEGPNILSYPLSPSASLRIR